MLSHLSISKDCCNDELATSLVLSHLSASLDAIIRVGYKSCVVSLVSLTRCGNDELATSLVLSHLSISLDAVMTSRLQ